MNEETFLSALHESPNDEVTWSALADWLDDDGQSERAEIVRLVRRLRSMPVMKRTKAKAALEDRVASLLNTGVLPVVPEIVNSIGMRLALIPPGTFHMGSPAKEKDRDDRDDMETPHEVTLTRPFYLGVFPVTQGQYEAVIGNNLSSFSPGGDEKESVKGLDTAEFPVEQVSWEDARTFLKKLSARREEKKAGREYRLPTEAEWEYGCRGGASSSTPFHVGASLSSTQANFNGGYPYGGAEKGPYLERPCAVGSYLPNAFGLYDICGNVWEWCADWYGNYEGGPATDPRGPSEGSYRVIRGGGWDCTARNCRSADRLRLGPEDRISDLGFRVALVPTM
jgi:uncharacterized protein (TIGR02996 family)